MLDTEPDHHEYARGERAACPVIGVGASAGGLEAFGQFLSNAKHGQGLAYVLIQHLDPNHESLLAELLGRRAELPVDTIKGGEKIQPDKAYLIPPNAQIAIKNGVLSLKSFEEPRGRRRPIDAFFQSLAEDQGENAACVVLSGTGADGADGLRAIKAGGGLALAQDPARAKYPGMPTSAIDTGLVDLVLPAREMAPILHDYFSRGELLQSYQEQAPEDFVDQISRTIRLRTGHDFSQYRRTTVLRRIARRMQVVGAKSDDEYLKLLISENDEADALFRDLLINVTSFFRDPEAFDTLRQDVIPALVSNKSSGDKFRAWVPGCSSGEEAYTIAMLVAEETGKQKKSLDIQIFATDIDGAMLARAREGVYAPSALNEVPPELADRYFEPDGEGYRISKPIRSIVRTSGHSIIKDPPFSKLDLISCRNLLIYFNNKLQRRLISIFHMSLRQGGYLFLGPSENLGEGNQLFEAVNETAKIYRRANVKTPPLILPMEIGDLPTLSPREAADAYQDEVRDRILQRYVPPHIVVGDNGEIKFASKRTSRYLEFPEGRPSLQISELSKPGLASAITALISTMTMEGKPRKQARDVTVEIDDEQITIDLYAEQLSNAAVLVVFNDRSTASGSGPNKGNEERIADTISYDLRVRELEGELSGAQQDLRTTVEELETSNEELKSSNEEMMSMNEELQSANEELTTVNEELQNKVAELARLNDDLSNYFDSTNIAVIILDGELKIREFTPATTAIFRLLDQDKGRILTDINAAVDSTEVVALAKKANSLQETVRVEIGSEEDEHIYLVQASPYRSAEGLREGIVLTFTDVTELRTYAEDLEEAHHEQRRQLQEIESLYKMSPVALGLISHNYEYLRVNQGLAEINGIPIEAHEGKRVDEVVPMLGDEVLAPIRQVFESGEAIHDLEVIGKTAAFPNEDRIWLTDWSPLKEHGEVIAVSVGVRDITEIRETEGELRRVMRELQHRVKNMLANILALVRQASVSDAPAQESINVLTQRITSLASTHDLLTQSNWSATPLTKILTAELIDVYGEERVSLKGPDIKISARATLSMAMAIHELATNAAKYGALSTPDGRLTVNWKLIDEGAGAELVLTWSEIGGPEAFSPEHQGFGSSLIFSSIEGSLDGEVERFFEPSGLVCVFKAPLSSITDDADNDDEEGP